MGFPDAELSITLLRDDEMAELAGRFGRSARATDVLAFSTLEGEGADEGVVERLEPRKRDRSEGTPEKREDDLRRLGLP